MGSPLEIGVWCKRQTAMVMKPAEVGVLVESLSDPSLRLPEAVRKLFESKPDDEKQEILDALANRMDIPSEEIVINMIETDSQTVIAFMCDIGCKEGCKLLLATDRSNPELEARIEAVRQQITGHIIDEVTSHLASY